MKVKFKIFWGLVILFLISNFALANSCDVNKLKIVKYGQKGEYVRNLQKCLINLGYRIPSGATGFYGKETLKAVKDFYKSWYGNWHGRMLTISGIQKIKELYASKSQVLKEIEKTFESRKVEFRKFNSKEEFKNYFKKVFREEKTKYLFTDIFREIFHKPRSLHSTLIPFYSGFTLESIDIPQSIKAPERVSETTVQVKGIDEPDIVKTDGLNIFYSREIYLNNPICFPEKCIFSYHAFSIIKAFPPFEAQEIFKTNEGGELLLEKNGKILLILDKNYNKITGYDVSNLKNPTKKWIINMEKDVILDTARLYQNKLYLVIKKLLNDNVECPLKLGELNNESLEIDCKNIYYPSEHYSVNLLYGVLVINPISGDIELQNAFLAQSEESVIYMSPNYIYITYTFVNNFENFILHFINENKDKFPQSILFKIYQLKFEKNREEILDKIEKILSEYYNSLNDAQKESLSKELTKKWEEYLDKNKRYFEKTIITKINIKDLNIEAIGNIPGAPLNQFALDEYQNYLRIAVTIGEKIRILSTVNDIYILNNNLEIIGSVQDLGKGERIYSVRFIEDKGYIVTFRETDPFFVLDLSKPYEPKLKGELKIPGYSSYLHPITKNKILGVGKEENYVKISLFDVTNPENPFEKDKYILKEETWSEILKTHHAFLLDEKHQLFFIPAVNKGYIFSYKNDDLTLIKEINNITAVRAIYLDDFLYIIGENVIIIYDENSWQLIKEITLQ